MFHIFYGQNHFYRQNTQGQARTLALLLQGWATAISQEQGQDQCCTASPETANTPEEPSVEDFLATRVKCFAF